MDAFLGKLTQHAVNYAIRCVCAAALETEPADILKRSGIAITATYATVDGSAQREEIMTLQERLDTKIRIISPAIDLIELISARGNTTLESAVSLTKTIRWDIQSLGQRLAKASAAEEISRSSKMKSKTKEMHEIEIKHIIKDMRRLLARIEDAVPLINLAITTSGAKLTTQLPSSVSPSRLLQASMFLTMGDNLYSTEPGMPSQIGPVFVLSLYMLFSAHNRRTVINPENGPRQSTWKEVLHKCHARLLRVPLNDLQDSDKGARLAPYRGGTGDSDARIFEYAYELELVEDFDDGRVHTFEDDTPSLGIRESFPVHQIARIFYADTGKILNIGADSETNNPILLLKRDMNALPPRRMMDESEQGIARAINRSPADVEPRHTSSSEEDSQDDIDNQLHRESSTFDVRPQELENVASNAYASSLPPDLDPEWLALEIFTPSTSDEDDIDDDSSVSSFAGEPDHDHVHDSGASPFDECQQDLEPQLVAELTGRLSNVNLDKGSPSSQDRRIRAPSATPNPAPQSSSIFGVAKNSLSLLEVLLRLTILQQFQQQNHLEISDELLTFFLQESSTGGLDDQQRRQLRRDARTKVGFDPYDESPIKRHGEEYQTQRQDGYSHEATPFSRGGTPVKSHNSSARAETPVATPDGAARREGFRARAPGSVESRYPSLNVYQSSPLGNRRESRPASSKGRSSMRTTLDLGKDGDPGSRPSTPLRESIEGDE